MTDRPVRHVAQELVNDLDVLAGQIRKLVEQEIHGSVHVGRTYEATGRTGFTPDRDGNPSGPVEKRADSTDPILATTVHKLKAAIRTVRNVEDYLTESDPDYRPCRVCGCNSCRAVRPRSNPSRCWACFKFRGRHNRDRNHEEIQEHRERMRYRNTG